MSEQQTAQLQHNIEVMQQLQSQLAAKEKRIVELEEALTNLLAHKTIDYADRREAQYALANKEMTKMSEIDRSDTVC